MDLPQDALRRFQMFEDIEEENAVEVFLKLGEAANAATGRLISANGLEYLACVFHAVDVADLVSVVSGDRDLFNAIALMVELDDDLRVEVEILGHVAEVDALQGM